MPKRRAQPESDDEASVLASPASKRARTEESDDEESSQQSTRAKGKSRASARRAVKEEEGKAESDDEDVNMEDEGNDEEFEQRYRDMVLAAMESKRKVSGVRLWSCCALHASDACPGDCRTWHHRVH